MKTLAALAKRIFDLKSWRYFWPLLAICLLMIMGAISALYANSSSFQDSITTPKPQQIIVLKKKVVETTQPSVSQAAVAEQAPASTAASTNTTTSTAKKSVNNSTLAQTACNDKINSIYFNYNMSLASENGRHQAELADIQQAYDLGLYEDMAIELADGRSAEQLRDQDTEEENTQWNIKTMQLAADQQTQMNATGCFGR